MLGFKELYDVQLKANYETEIKGKTITVGEPIATFESVQFGSVNEFKAYVGAKGGYGNQSWVGWETTREVEFNFSQGVLSKIHLALLSNADIKPAAAISVPKIEKLEVDDELKITLKYTPILSTLYIYDTNGNKITDYTITDNLITFNSIAPYIDVTIIYEFEYTDGADIIAIGRRLISGYLELSGKTRLKDDKTGQTTTGILRIPKLKLVSDLSIRLGKDATPVIGNFKTVGYPVGSKGSERVLDFILLNDDIDSDM